MTHLLLLSNLAKSLKHLGCYLSERLILGILIFGCFDFEALISLWIFLFLLLLIEIRWHIYLSSLKFWKFRLFYLSLTAFLNLYKCFIVETAGGMSLTLLLDIFLDYVFSICSACLKRPIPISDRLFLSFWNISSLRLFCYARR